ncbi:YihY/virulence factor BrkB family protein [Chitinimonas sp. PSY-7]|uniref:YhjD/YihY/BrkB family envelope integrity protein n=1 Tax=Chitinimonas sp. PSY-7 TaxID=3459088 RepID=UPI004040160A
MAGASRTSTWGRHANLQYIAVMDIPAFTFVSTGCRIVGRASGFDHGAAIAFYTLFSMGPVLVIAIAIAGSFYGDAAAQAGLLAQVQALLGQQAASAVSLVIQGANQPDRATWQTILAVATSLFAATTVFTELKSSLDVIWDAPKNQQQGIFALIRSRLLSFGIVLSVGFILLVSLLLSTVIAAVESRYGQWFGMSVTVLSLISNLVTTLIVTLLFAAIFKLLPACPVAWKDVWRGAFLTVCLYMLGKGLIAMYLGTTALASSYGSAGTLVLILLWMYYSAQVFLYGAELSRAMAQQRAINESEEEAVHLAQAAPSLHI